MNPMQQQVHEFLVKHLGTRPDGWPNSVGETDFVGRFNKWLLIREEFEELTEALGLRLIPSNAPGQFMTAMPAGSYDEPATVDAICDLLYVIFNLVEELKLDIEPFFNEVHRANMTKVPGRLSPTKKILKPDNFEPPKIKMLLEAWRLAKSPSVQHTAPDGELLGKFMLEVGVEGDLFNLHVFNSACLMSGCVPLDEHPDWSPKNGKRITT